MKLAPDQKVIIGKHVYKGEIPDGVAKNAGIVNPAPAPEPKPAKKDADK